MAKKKENKTRRRKKKREMIQQFANGEKEKKIDKV